MNEERIEQAEVETVEATEAKVDPKEEARKKAAEAQTKQLKNIEQASIGYGLAVFSFYMAIGSLVMWLLGFIGNISLAIATFGISLLIYVPVVAPILLIMGVASIVTGAIAIKKYKLIKDEDIPGFYQRKKFMGFAARFGLIAGIVIAALCFLG